MAFEAITTDTPKTHHIIVPSAMNQMAFHIKPNTQWNFSIEITHYHQAKFPKSISVGF